MNRESIESIINEEDFNKILQITPNIKDSSILHFVAEKYNWDDGFELPRLIIDNPNTELSTALLLFYDGGGFDYLTDLSNKENTKDRCNFGFIDNLYKRLVAEEFVRGSISYVPNLTKVQIFKFKKENPNISDIFYYGYQGVVVK
ncbi:DUF4274 domain-containing protein [Clostridium paraputrificum]|uniref:DUF4274 domain-containing protein n=1 Tax=Clostridium paraputrificum TaxID=29363 RepID=UPI0006C663C3|nr:DUF4274 domain-containing protein [Clostridium paraputrificum]CUO20806.1 Uncharacterised protein [Clostridium paraputrificum]